MSRPWVLVCLLLLIVFTSQLEWKQQYGNELEASPNTPQKLETVSARQESVKEKIILSQEKNIQKLNELVQRLREQLLLCKGEIELFNGTTTQLTELLPDFEKHPVVED
ncbi:putative Peptidyl-prolyl cis-trans isomerase G [Quillaja saponaria]|uniref:Peptidyl-prolyl cis-trans isomerase G n=1 Tax=Quillaja saponaria TaxID=32244 RepID=A0AAD7Q7A2_QUISA|nr:putative Peptidyl-prolyl cis-trans isomerase G [Quillaja saponaria]